MSINKKTQTCKTSSTRGNSPKSSLAYSHWKRYNFTVRSLLISTYLEPNWWPGCFVWEFWTEPKMEDSFFSILRTSYLNEFVTRWAPILMNWVVSLRYNILFHPTSNCFLGPSLQVCIPKKNEPTWPLTLHHQPWVWTPQPRPSGTPDTGRSMAKSTQRAAVPPTGRSTASAKVKEAETWWNWWRFLSYLGGGLKYFVFSPLLREDYPFWLIFFEMGWNHQLVINWAREKKTGWLG